MRSQIWNLARPEHCRKQFDSSSTLKLICSVITKHSVIHLVIETALGALSNLVLFEKIRVECGKPHVLQFLVEVIVEHTNHCNVATASAGLITNLAHSNVIAARLTDIGGISLIVHIMSQHSHDTHLQRNCCAALSNMSSSSGYVHRLVECLGIERLFASLNLAALNPSSSIEPLAEQALFIMDIDWTKVRMSSLHIASKKGLYHSVYKCIVAMAEMASATIDVLDSNGNTSLHYAVEHEHEKVTKLLVSRGSDLAILNKAGKSPFDIAQAMKRDVMLDAIRVGLDQLKLAKAAMMACIMSNNKTLPPEIAGIICTYISAVEVMYNYGNDGMPTSQRCLLFN